MNGWNDYRSPYEQFYGDTDEGYSSYDDEDAENAEYDYAYDYCVYDGEEVS